MTGGKVLTDEARARAEARFKVSEQRRTDAEQVKQEVRDAKQAEQVKTARLRELRLAKEEADHVAAEKVPPAQQTRRRKVTA